MRRLVAELPNSGLLDGATHHARAENPVCGDVAELEFRIQNGTIEACGYRVTGCPAAIAAVAGLSLILTGKPVSEARDLSKDQLLTFLGGLPSHKRHALDLAIQAVHSALND